MSNIECPENRFTAYKVSICGNQFRYDFVNGLTLKEARNETKFPLGEFEDKQGKYKWSYGLTNKDLYK